MTGRLEEEKDTGQQTGKCMDMPHIPVMTEDVCDILAVRPGGIYIDATVGAGGHAAAILERSGFLCTVIGIDRDEDAILESRRRLGENSIVLKGAFSDLPGILRPAGFEKADGVLFDLGVSMMQLMVPERGFSFRSDAVLDMRMDRGQELTAAGIVNEYSEKRIEEILRDYGEEPRARRVARAIAERRRIGRICTCRELADLTARAAGGRRGRRHPATRVFQALRIAVNEETGQLEQGLSSSLAVLRENGRLCIISYHSIEDRITKRFLAANEKAGNLRILTRKPRVPSREEIQKNPSSRSAKLRGAERICHKSEEFSCTGQ